MTNIRDIDGTLRIYTAGLVAERPVHEHIQEACDLAAEVIRLRDVVAAWEWLAAKYEVAREDDMRWFLVACVPELDAGGNWVRIIKATAADPVALATALDKDWRVQDAE